ncbi:MAG: caspase family protein [Bacteroidia bacterium]|nr:caspase family protein [Bacteroidia bacterium]
MPKNQTQPKLFALLVGINEYSHLPSNKQLEGCINDVNLFASYLEKDFVRAQFSEIHVQKITSPGNIAATKANIVKAFEEHLGKTQAGDVAVFYYSGHGIREIAALPVFAESEIDGNIAGLLCMDFNQNPGETVIADKELRYLIRKIAGENNEKAHVVTVFDCCHSGENTRSVFGAAESAVAKSRQVEYRALKGRSPEQFIFNNDPVVKSKLAKNLPLDEVLPQGNHVMLAACREVELAWEAPNQTGTNGAFTRALVDILESHKGRVSYHELHNRVTNRMRFFFSSEEDSRDKRQTPQFYIRSDNPGNRYNVVLTNEPNGLPSYATVEKVDNGSEKEWRMDIGALHGVPMDATSVKVSLFPHNDPQAKTQTKIKAVFLTHSTLDLGKDFNPGPGVSLRAEVDGLSFATLKIAILAKSESGNPTRAEEGAKMAREELKKLLGNQKVKSFELTDKEGEADYVLIAGDEVFSTTRAGDHKRPVLLPIKYREGNKLLPEKVNVAFEDFRQMALWTFLRDLETPTQGVPEGLHISDARMYPVELFVQKYEGGKEKRLLPKDKEITLEVGKENALHLLRFELKNYSDQLLYVSLIYMPSSFAFLADEKKGMMERPQLGLEKWTREGDLTLKSRGKKMENGQKYIGIGVDNYIINDNWPGQENYMKLIVSATPFDLTPFHLDPIALPGTTVSTDRTRGFDFEEEEEKPALPKITWEVSTYKLYVANLQYDIKKEKS